MPRISRSQSNPKVLTLKSRAEFQRIRGGIKWGTRGFMLEAKARTTVDTGAPLHATAARFGFTITKKVGNAVERNRMRRRLKEAVRKLQGVHALGGTDYVLIARRPLLDCDFAQLMQDLEGALQRVKGPANGRAIDGRRATDPKPTQAN